MCASLGLPNQGAYLEEGPFLVLGIPFADFIFCNVSEQIQNLLNFETTKEDFQTVAANPCIYMLNRLLLMT